MQEISFKTIKCSIHPVINCVELLEIRFKTATVWRKRASKMFGPKPHNFVTAAEINPNGNAEACMEDISYRDMS